jgi:hypothetical protein
MLNIKLDFFSIGTITVPIHIELVPTTDYIPNTVITKPILKQPVKSVGVLTMKLTIPRHCPT